MEAIRHINLPSLLDTLVSVGAAFLLGSLIGFERQVRQRTAGLRTNTLVAVGAAVFVDMAARLGGPDGAVRVVAYVVSGIGFLGAGAIMKEGANITGLNTAATLWGSAAVGACAGADLLGEALIAALFVLASNTLLRPVVNRINRRPVHEESSEATYTVRVICSRAARPGDGPAAGAAGSRELPGARHRPARLRAGRHGDCGNAVRHRGRARRARPGDRGAGNAGRRSAGVLERLRGGLAALPSRADNLQNPLRQGSENTGEKH